MAPTRPLPTRLRALGLPTCAVLAVAASAGCAAGELVSHEKTQHYDVRADAPVRGHLAFVLPDAVPADATDVTVRVATREPYKKMYEWSSATAPSGCVPQDGDDVPAPFDDSVDWPARVATGPGLRCGGLHVAEVDGRYYGWLLPGEGVGGPSTATPSRS